MELERLLLWYWFNYCLLILYDKFSIQIFRLVRIYENEQKYHISSYHNSICVF
jgi:hypothetical protein